MSNEQRGAIENARVIIRDRHVETLNIDRLKAGEVVERLKETYPFFNMSHHVLAWRYYRARPPSNAGDPARTDTRYCVYDRAHRDYLYTGAWVAKLKEELRAEAGVIQRWKAPERAH